MTDYLTSARKQFEYYKLLGEKTIAQLMDEQLFWQYNHESNSIAMIVKHLWGNMLSRWTDFLTTDGHSKRFFPMPHALCPLLFYFYRLHRIH